MLLGSFYGLQLRNVEVVEKNIAGVRLYQADDLIKRSRLAGAVRPQEADDLALVDFKRYLVDDSAPPIPLNQIACMYSHSLQKYGLPCRNCFSGISR